MINPAGRFLRTTIATILTLSAAQAAAQVQNLTPTHLKVMGSWSFMSLYADFEQPFWSKEITEKSGGRITAEITPINQAGLKGPEIFRLMNIGLVDVATASLGYVASDEPAGEAVDLAGLAPAITTARAVSDAWKPVLDARYQSKHGLKLIGIWPYPAQVILCKQPMKSLSDLKGRKVRTANRTVAEFVEALGASSITMPIGDVIPALERGVMDCAVSAAVAAYHQKWFQTVRYVYELNLGWSNLASAMSLKTWNRLPPGTRDFIQSQVAGLEDRIWKAIGKESEEGMDCLTGRKSCPRGAPANMVLVAVDEKDRKLLDQILRTTVVPKWAQRCGPACAKEWNSTIAKVVNIRAD